MDITEDAQRAAYVEKDLLLSPLEAERARVELSPRRKDDPRARVHETCRDQEVHGEREREQVVDVHGVGHRLAEKSTGSVEIEGPGRQVEHAAPVVLHPGAACRFRVRRVSGKISVETDDADVEVVAEVSDPCRDRPYGSTRPIVRHVVRDDHEHTRTVRGSHFAFPRAHRISGVAHVHVAEPT